MTVSTATTFFSLLALGCVTFAVFWLTLTALAPALPGAAELRERVRESIGETGLTLAFLVALTSMLGSLYYSEVANFEPCKLCWYQRIAMYPLALLLGIAAWRRDLAVRFYAYPLAAAGAVVAVYHYLLQRFPSLDTGACSATVPCSSPYVNFEFGIVTIPFMALAGFAAILVLVWIAATSNPSTEPALAGVPSHTTKD